MLNSVEFLYTIPFYHDTYLHLQLRVKGGEASVNFRPTDFGHFRDLIPSMAKKAQDETLQADKEVAMTAVASDGLALPHCHQSLRADRDVVLRAVSSALAMQLFR